MANFAEEMDMDDQEQLFFGHLGPVKREPRATENGTIPPTLGPAKRQRLEPQDRSKGKGGKGKNKGKGKGNPLPGQSLHHGGYPMSQARGYSTGSGEELPAPWAGDRAAPNLGDNSSWMGDRTSQRLGRDHRESADWMEHRVTRLTQLVLRQEQTLANLRQDMMLYLLGQGDDPGNVSGSGQEEATERGIPGKTSDVSKIGDVQAVADLVVRTVDSHAAGRSSHGPRQEPRMAGQRPELAGSPLESS